MNQKLSKKSPILQLDELNLDQIGSPGEMIRAELRMMTNPLSEDINIPVIIAKGKHPGKVLGLTAVIHGNEINGMLVIQEIIKSLDLKKLHGTIIAVPVVNRYGFTLHKRDFVDNIDLNRIMPGKKKGSSGEQFAYYFHQKIVKKLDYLIDLHTASTGRINTLYVRSNLKNKTTLEMAKLQNPDIILHHEGIDGSLRSAAQKLGIPSITVEIGNPLKIQKSLIKNTCIGIKNVLSHFKFTPSREKQSRIVPKFCKKSEWIYTDIGGVLEVSPELNEIVKEGQIIAKVNNIYGDLIKEYKAPFEGIVIGKAVNPVSFSGTRFIHLGRLGKP